MKNTHNIKRTLFIYTGTDKKGTHRTGEIYANNATSAKNLLRKQGIQITTLKIKRQSWFKHNLWQSPIKTIDITQFIRQLATMITAGIPLLNSIQIIANGTHHKLLFQLYQSIKQDLENGYSLASSLAKYPKYFNELDISLIEIAELSGTLEQTLQSIALYREKNHQLTQKVKKALLYPAIVLIVAMIVSVILMLFVVPIFQELFQSNHLSLPMMTQIVISISQTLQHYWFILIALPFMFYVFYKMAYARSAKFQHYIAQLQLKLPIIGKLYHRNIMARFSRTLATTFSAGLPLTDALKSTAKVVNHSIYQHTILDIYEQVTHGQQLYFALQQSKQFPTFATQMIEIGEESGSLDIMLNHLAQHFENEVEHQIEQMTILIEPILIIFLGLIIGSLVVAMYLPILNMGNLV